MLRTARTTQLRATVAAEYGVVPARVVVTGRRPPANLQGIWNDELRPAWSSNYTININTQMNYWAAESPGWPSAHEPLLRPRGARSRARAPTRARELYGARGWVAHHNTDLWGWSLPVGMGHGSPELGDLDDGRRLAHPHLWDHSSSPATSICCAPASGRCCAEPPSSAWTGSSPDRTGRCDTSPSTSPENLFIWPQASDHDRPDRDTTMDCT